MARSIDYGNLMHRAMRGLIQTVLADVARDGLVNRGLGQAAEGEDLGHAELLQPVAGARQGLQRGALALCGASQVQGNFW